jgi:hypothetical protein
MDAQSARVKVKHHEPLCQIGWIAIGLKALTGDIWQVANFTT